MGHVCRSRCGVLRLILAVTSLCVILTAADARAQWGLYTGQLELSDAVKLDHADSAARTQIEQVDRYLADEQWADAIAVLRQLAQQSGNKLVPIEPNRHIPLRDYCHLRLASLPPDALALYREQVDPQAEVAFEQAVAARDPARLRSIVDEMYCSSWGDDALLALGEMALEAGMYGRARAYWQQLLPDDVGEDPDEEADDDNTPPRLAYPDTDLPLADVHARLVLTSLMEGSLERATAEFELLQAASPEAKGRLGGREVAYSEILPALLEAARDWPQRRGPERWWTFAGSPTRSASRAEAIDVGAEAWRVDLPRTPTADGSMAMKYGFRPSRVAEDHKMPLSYHPLVVGDLVLVNTLNEVLAFDAASGEPAWGRATPVIFRLDRGQESSSRNTLGVPRFTMTSDGRRLFVRLGSPATTSTGQYSPRSYLVCLDLEAQGRLMWQIEPGEEGYSFEGPPVTDGANVYFALRRSDVHSQAHVACHDAQTGRRLWRRFVCAAETPGHGQVDEITHNLLTLADGMLYFNTNLGAVAALSAPEGDIQWITLYPRGGQQSLGEQAAHYYRDLNPCVYDRGRLFIAPSDSNRILALDAATGAELWQSTLAEDVVHLLGVGQGNLLASGDRLWWIDAATGKVRDRFPAAGKPRGFGRGVLAGGYVYWPALDDIQKVYVFDQAAARTRRVIHITTPWDWSRTAGNLVVGDGFLLVATAQSLACYSEYGRLLPRYQEDVARKADDPAAQFRLATCLAALERGGEAAEAFSTAATLATDDHRIDGRPLAQIAREHAFNLQMEHSESLAAAGRLDEAAQWLKDASLAAPTPRHRARAIFAAAEKLVTSQRAGEAVSLLESLMDDAALADELIEVAEDRQVRCRVWAERRLDELTGAVGIGDAEEAHDDAADNGLDEPVPLMQHEPLDQTGRVAWADPAGGRGAACVAVAGRMVYGVSPGEEASKWMLELDQPVLWSQRTDASLVLGSAAEFCALDTIDGTVLWRREGATLFGIVPNDGPKAPPTGLASLVDRLAISGDSPLRGGQPLRFNAAVDGERIFVLHDGGPLVALNMATGETAWQFDPPSERLGRYVAVAGSHVVTDTHAGDGILILAAAEGRLVGRIDDERRHWSQSPRAFPDGQIMAVTQRGELRMYDLAAGKLCWTYRPAEESAPDRIGVYGDHNVLLVQHAGRHVERLDPRDGRRLWREPLAIETKSAKGQDVLAGVDARHAYVIRNDRESGTSTAVLRALDLGDGKPRWQRPLTGTENAPPNPFAPWQVEPLEGLLAVHQRALGPAAPTEIRLLAAGNGRLVDTLEFDVPPRYVTIHSGRRPVAAAALRARQLK